VTTSEDTPRDATTADDRPAAGSAPVTEVERPDEPAAGSGATAWWRDRSRWPLYAALAALLLLVAGALLLGWQLRSAAQDAAARNDALSAARQSAINLTSIDQEDFADDVAAVLDGATGEFRSDFAARSGDLERLLTENEVVAEGQVLESALVRSDRRTATALVVVDSTVRNTATPDGRVNSYRMKLELERVGDRWLTSVLEFVG
jgi:Mce-associated membrane protein